VVAGAVTSARDVDEFVVPASRLNGAEMAALPSRRQPMMTTIPLSPPESAKPLTQDVLPAQSPSPAVAAVTAAYVIGPDDVLAITVWQQRDLTTEALVRPDGKISFPLIGDIQAAGLTPERLRQRLIEALGTFVQSPQVSVQVRQINSRRAFITGAVVKPGGYQLSESMTVVQLIAMAGGLTVFAKADAIAIVRRVDGKNVSIPFDYAAFVSGQQLEQNIPLLPGDTVVVR
jgi:polysaccharide export outer membrane protein